MQDSSSSSTRRTRTGAPLVTGGPVSMTPAAATSSAISSSASRALPWSGLGVALAVIAVLCAYLLPGTLGHDPWKQDETYTFGIIQHMLETGDWIVPTNAGQPFVEKPPLYDWVATGLAWAFERYLPLHDAARLASALFMAMTLGCVARFTRAATRARSWFDARVLGTFAVFAGTLVVLKHSHDMMTDVALMAGTALGFCGLFELVTAFVRRPHAVNRQASLTASAMLGAGVGIAFLSKGLFVPLVFGATFCALPVLYPACRSRAFARSLVPAALVFAPFALIWPIAFYLRSEALFKVWFWDNNVGRFFGFSVPALGSENDKPLFIWRSLFSVGFPVAPLAAIALAGGAWRRWREPRVALPVVFSGTGMIVLQMSATARELYVLPFIAPLALLALQGVERLPQRVHVVWDYASRTLFGTIAALTWVVWSDMTDSTSAHAGLKLLGRWLPLDWTLPIKPNLMLPALVLTLSWLCLMPLLARTGKWRGAFSWCTGAIVAWGLVFTLLLPWIDAAKSYRSVFEDLDTHLNVEWNAGDCMASVNLGESEAPMLYYFAGVLHKPTDAPKTTACRWLITQSYRSDATRPDGNWTPYWSGARPGDDSELLRVFVRKPSLVAALH
ncbi:glycosyl transferase [Trinickia sp. YCB016]